MEIKNGPNSVDEPNILYKLQSKIKVFNTNNPLPNRGYNLVTSSSKYGIVFIVSPNCFLSAYYLKDVINKDCEPAHVTLKLQQEPTHISVNCDQEWLAVISSTMLLVYKVTDFQNQNTLPSFTIKLDVNPSSTVSSVQWNPCVTDNIAIAFLDGTLLVSQVNTMQVKKLQSNARCLCWSPKGKQIVTGNNDGSLCQYKPDLSPMKVVPPPNLFEGAAVEALAIFWISTYQFAVVYKNATDNSRPAVTIVNTPKGGQPSSFNYEDICYSMGSSRPWYYYLQGLTQWNMILASSSNSMEIATLGSGDGANWFQWCQVDEARPELPLTNKTEENYPIGICIDTCAIHQLPWGENETLPPMPLLLVLSQTGLLTIFNIVNLKKEAPTICAPHQQLILPASIMTSAIPDDAPQPTTTTSAPPPNQAAQQPVQPAQVQPAFQPPPSQPQPLQLSANQFGQAFANVNLQSFGAQKPQAPPTGIFTSSAPQTFDPKPIEAKSQVPIAQTQLPVAPTQPVTTDETPKPQTPIKAQEIDALKNEQEQVNRMKANEELKNMLIKEVNDFQIDLYKFTMKMREGQIKLHKEIESINMDFNINPKDVEIIKIDCSIEELREAIVQLKLDLVRACAVVAEVRTHTDTQNLHDWNQADPLTMKRVASVKKLAYYVQNQLEQAHRALDHKWNEIAMRNPNEKPGQRMLRPILDDIYQPLVKQQEILSRQQAVLRSLKNTLRECGDVAPAFKTTSILRSTPFRNKADPLSKLTKNILNMSIEPEKDKVKDQKVMNQKLDTLRDMLSNHKTVKIKPVNVELRQQLAAMRINYEKSMKEKHLKERENLEAKLKVELQSPKIERSVPLDIKPNDMKAEAKNIPAITVPTYTPMSKTNVVRPVIPNVARTLFTDDEPKTEPVYQAPKPQQTVVPALVKQEQIETPNSQNITVTASTRILLKGMLQNKSQAIAEQNEANTFMGQKICSPTALSFSETTAAQPAGFTAKPIADISNMINKLQPQTLVDTKPTKANTQSNETGESDSTKTDTKQSNVFAPKPVTSSNVPDVLRSAQPIFSKTDVKSKEVDSKENIPENKAKETLKVSDDNQPKPFGLSNKSSVVAPQSTVVPEAVKPEDSSEKSKSIFGANAVSTGPKPSSVFGKPTTQSVFQSFTATSANTSDASSIFGKAVALQKSSPDGKSTGSLFGTTTTSGGLGSIFGSQAKTSASVFGSAAVTTASQPAVDKVAATISTQAEVVSTAVTTTTTPTTVITTAVTSTTAPTTSGATIPSTTQGMFAPTPVSVFSSTGSKSDLASTTTTPATTSSFWPTSAPNWTSPATQSSVFGTSTKTTQASVFGLNTTTESVFGTATPSTTTQTSIFGTATPTTTPQASVFGTATPTTTPQASVFGTATTPTTTPQASVFGTATPTTTSQAPVFGSAAPSTTTQASLFGTATPTTSAQGSIFGSTTPTRTTQSSIFGSNTPTTTTQASIFGTPTSTTQASIFGASSSTTSQASIFGAQTTTTQSIFGTTPSTQASVFGTSQSVFGTTSPAFPTTTAQSASLFGSSEANLFASATISTTSATSSSGGSIFGASSGGSVFGDGSTNVFGGKSTFGQTNQSAAAIFGGANSTFKQNTSSFWGSGNTTGNAFGSSTFGQQATTQASLFGGSLGGSFSTPSTGQPLGSPNNAFGSPQQQTSSSFGGSAVFGSKPVFGQTAGFGSPTSGFGSGFGGFNKSPSGFGAPATFGGAPTFGSPGFGGSSPEMFGGSSPAQNFGAPTQSNSTFESLASQNTITFGNLAQQSTPPQQQSSFNTSPSFTGWRG